MNNKPETIVVSVAVLIGVTALLLGTLIGFSGRKDDSGAPAPAAAPTPAAALAPAAAPGPAATPTPAAAPTPAASFRNYDEIFIPNSVIGALDARRLKVGDVITFPAQKHRVSMPVPYFYQDWSGCHDLENAKTVERLRQRGDAAIDAFVKTHERTNLKSDDIWSNTCGNLSRADDDQSYRITETYDMPNGGPRLFHLQYCRVFRPSGEVMQLSGTYWARLDVNPSLSRAP
jgi:hypothetical protein